MLSQLQGTLEVQSWTIDYIFFSKDLEIIAEDWWALPTLP